MPNLINHEPDIDKKTLYSKDPYEAKYQLLFNKRKSKDIKYLMILKSLSNAQMIWIIVMNILKYNSNKKGKILIVFDDMIADMLSNKKLNLIVTELFIRGTN